MRTQNTQKNSVKNWGRFFLRLLFGSAVIAITGMFIISVGNNLNYEDPNWDFCHSPEISLKTVDELPVKCLWYYTR